MSVLDASAVLALIHDEPGADVVARELKGSWMSTANLAEVVGKLVDIDIHADSVRRLLDVAGVEFQPLTAADAELAGALRSIPGGRQLSLGDRCCLALAVRADPPRVLTGDRAWADLDLPVEVSLVR